MFVLKDEHIDFILSDIRQRGVELEDLQQNLLDHICCLMEQECPAERDFKENYQQVIQRFYKEELWEIEEETYQLLTFKNYYTMKKILIGSGLFSAASIVIAFVLRQLHFPGAGILFFLGVVSFCLIYLPLLLVLKTKDTTSKQQKAVVVIGILAGMVCGISILFKVMHWPFANILRSVGLLSILAIFLPVYFITGYRQAETRFNTLVTSIMILVGGTLFYYLSTPRVSRHVHESMIAQLSERLTEVEGNYSAIHQLPSPASDLPQEVEQAFADFQKAAKALRVKIIDGACHEQDLRTLAWDEFLYPLVYKQELEQGFIPEVFAFKASFHSLIRKVKKNYKEIPPVGFGNWMDEVVDGKPQGWEERMFTNNTVPYGLHRIMGLENQVQVMHSLLHGMKPLVVSS